MPAREPQTGRVPGFLHFTADDWRALAMAARVAMVQAENDAKGQSNPQVVAGFSELAEYYRQLAEKCENAARVR